MWKGVYQAQSGRGGRKGCSPLLSCMLVDSATAYVPNGIAAEADVRNGEPKAEGDLTVGNSCRAGGPASMWRTVSFLGAQASLATCSKARMSTIREVRMV